MTCATVGCELSTSGNSKYCAAHKREARAAWLDKVRASAQERETRSATFAALWAKAVEAARKAHAEAIPTPMTVVEENLLTGEQGKRWYVSEGACGFGTVKVMPGNCSFALWLTKNNYARKSYTGGVSISTNYGSQSVARAEAAAYAMADVLREAGIKAYGSSNLD